MKFCSVCQRAIKKRIFNDKIVFKCVCEHIEPTNDEDVLISSGITKELPNIEKYDKLIYFAPFDRTNQLVYKDCPDCGLDYLTQIRIGENEIIIYRCKCGYKLIIE